MAGRGRPLSTCARMCVSVPRRLRVEMKRHPEINWSAVAQGAFERKLVELGYSPTPDEVFARMTQLRETLELLELAVHKGRK